MVWMWLVVVVAFGVGLAVVGSLDGVRAHGREWDKRYPVPWDEGDDDE